MAKNPMEPLRKLSPMEWPPEASARVIEALASKDVAARFEAAQLAWHAMNDEVAAALVRTLRDPHAMVAGAAAITLGSVLEEHDGPSQDEAWARVGSYTTTSRATFEAIRRELEGVGADPKAPEHVRRCCLEAAVRAPLPWVDRAVRVALTKSDEWRVTGVFCSGFLPGLEDDIVEALDDVDPDVQTEAVRAAGLRGLTETEPRLRQLAADEEVEVDLRVVAIEALGRLPLPPKAAGQRTDSIEGLLDRLTGDDDEEIAFAAAAALEQRELAASLARFGSFDPFA